MKGKHTTRWILLGILVFALLFLLNLGLKAKTLLEPMPQDMGLRTTSPSQSYEDRARAFLESGPSQNGLRDFVGALDAIEAIPKSARDAASCLTDAAIRDGSALTCNEAGQLLQQSSVALTSARAAAGAPVFEHPPVDPEDMLAARPSLFVHGNLIVKLMLLDALNRQSQGQPGEALEKALTAARFSDRFCSGNLNLVANRQGLHGLDLSFAVIEPLLLDPRLDQKAISEAGSALLSLERNHTWLEGPLEMEYGWMLANFLELARHPAVRKKAKAGNSLTIRMIGAVVAPFSERVAEIRKEIYGKDGMLESILDPSGFEAAHNQLWEALDAELEKPFHERDIIDEAWISSRMPHQGGRKIVASNFALQRILTEEAVTMARLRLLQGLCALRMNRPDVAERFTDPFSGESIRPMGNLIYSIGPDRKDDGGTALYDPKNGFDSPGDIVCGQKTTRSIPAMSSGQVNEINAWDAAGHVGSRVRVRGRVVDAAYLQQGQKLTFLNLERPYPDQPCSAMIEDINRSRFPTPPESYYLNRTIVIDGTIERYTDGSLFMRVTGPEQIVAVE